MSEIFIHNYDNIISVENLLLAWQEFIKGKKNKKDVQEFQLNFMENIFDLHQDLKNKTYTHSPYKAFKINDPKPRDIHKACVRDRLLHHAIYRILYPYFDNKFIYDSYSCRLNKGTHKAIQRFIYFERIVSKNNTKQCHVLKCDIRKFFANINHDILKMILIKNIKDIDVLNLLENIIGSFCTNCSASLLIPQNHLLGSQERGIRGEVEKGLPLGNLTSQLLVNIYMNEFDQYMKHVLKLKYYIRYADDFVILHTEKTYLENLIKTISIFLQDKLKLQMHPNKVFIKTVSSGLDFLGWVHFSNHRVLRNATKKRMFRNLNKNDFKKESVNSYLGMLSYGNGYELAESIKISL